MIVDGEAVRSCLLTLGEMEGRSVTTIEALSPDRNHPVQQAFLGAYQNLGRFRGDSAFSTWMTRITMNEAM